MTGKLLSIRFELLQEISSGPVFSTWSAKDRVGMRDVSIRLLNQPFNQEEAFHNALRQCIDETADIKHPGIERIMQLDRDEEAVYLVCDPVRGMPLSDRIKKLAPYSVPVAVGTAVTICEALAALHRAGHTHGDVGSHHISVLPEGTAILQTAGLWKAYAASKTAGANVLPQMAPYLAPEVSQGSLPTPASDVYAVGVILYQLLTGKYPYEGEGPIATAMKHVNEPLVPVREISPQIPVALDEVVKKALAKTRTERYPSSVEMLSDLRMIQDALRFGRSLGWPLHPQPEPSTGDSDEPVPLPKSMDRASQPKSVVEEDWSEPSDVPNWLKGVLVFFGVLLALMIGAWVVFNLQKPKEVVVPDVQRRTLAEAEQILKPVGLKLRVTRRVLNEQVPADVVLETDPEAGAKVYVGDTLSATISAGSRFVEVPDMRGMTVDKAKIMLDSLGLELDPRIEYERDPDVEKGMVLKQIPEPRTRVERKTEIRVVVSSGKERVKPRTEDTTKYLYTIRIELSDITEQVMLRVDMTDARGTKTIDERERQPGELVELTAEGYGGEALFRIYYNGELVTQVKREPDEPVEEN